MATSRSLDPIIDTLPRLIGINKITELHLLKELLEGLSVRERAKIKSVSKRFSKAISLSRINESNLTLVSLPILGSIPIPKMDNSAMPKYGSFFEHARNHISSQRASLVNEARDRSAKIYNPLNRACQLAHKEGVILAAILSICLLLIGTISLFTEKNAKTEDAIILSVGGFFGLCALLPKISQVMTKKVAQRRINVFLGNGLNTALISDQTQQDIEAGNRVVMGQIR